MEKKEEILSFIIEEYKKIDSYISENKINNALEQFFNTVKVTFAKIFDIKFQFTYEEFEYKLQHMELILDEVDENVKKIKEKIEKTYALKKKDEIKTIKKTLKELNSELNKEIDRKNGYLRLNTILLENDVKEKVISFSKKISDLRYSRKETNKNSLVELMERFHEIVNTLLQIEKKEIEASSWILSRLHRLAAPFRKFNFSKVSKVHFLLTRAEAEITRDNFDNAKMIYLKMLIIYSKMRNRERKETYNIILSLYEHIQSKPKH